MQLCALIPWCFDRATAGSFRFPAGFSINFRSICNRNPDCLTAISGMHNGEKGSMEDLKFYCPDSFWPAKETSARTNS